MSIVNIEKIINGTPQKRLLNGYNRMKENYTEASAQEYYDIYKDEPLSFLLENSRIIFSEPYYGYKYYKEAIENISNCDFTVIESESEKVRTYLEENGSSMSVNQRQMYEVLDNTINNVLEHTKNTRIYASYIKENIDDRFEEKLSNAMFIYENSEDKNDSDIIQLIESVENPITFFTYAPYVISKLNTTSLNDKVNEMFEKASIPEEYNESKWKTFTEAVVCGNKLSLDSFYKESVNGVGNRDIRFIFEYFMNTSLNEKLEELVEEKVNINDVCYSSPVLAVNNIFNDIYEATIDKEELELQKDQLEVYKNIAYESTLDIIVSEYQQGNNTDDIAQGYTVLNESISIEKAFEKINNIYSESTYVTEEEDSVDTEDDVDDKDIEEMDKEVNDTGKKPQAPKPKNLANKVQFNAMDKEAQQMKKTSIRKQKGQEVKNAVKAVAQIPKNVLLDIKRQIKAVDEVDDERRKNYMTEPGFRKKAFRNLKLAVLYGSAAKAKLALVPVVAVARHFSKQKDMRVRNELVRELQTEIKVCEEKISDANANGDQKEKYRLIRIKDQLDAEMVRVKTNSKYV